jgi:hypothetical protein
MLCRRACIPHYTHSSTASTSLSLSSCRFRSMFLVTVGNSGPIRMCRPSGGSDPLSRVLARALCCSKASCVVVVPSDDAEAAALERCPGRLRCEKEADAFIACPWRRIKGLPSWPGRDILECEAAGRFEDAAHLGIEPVPIGDIHCCVLRPHQIEALRLRQRAREAGLLRCALPKSRQVNYDGLRGRERLSARKGGPMPSRRGMPH